MSEHDLHCFKLMVAKTVTERGLVLALHHAEDRAADLRQTDCERERTAEAVAYVRSQLEKHQFMKGIVQFPVPHGLRDAA